MAGRSMKIAGRGELWLRALSAGASQAKSRPMIHNPACDLQQTNGQTISSSPSAPSFKPLASGRSVPLSPLAPPSLSSVADEGPIRTRVQNPHTSPSVWGYDHSHPHQASSRNKDGQGECCSCLGCSAGPQIHGHCHPNDSCSPVYGEMWSPLSHMGSRASQSILPQFCRNNSILGRTNMTMMPSAAPSMSSLLSPGILLHQPLHHPCHILRQQNLVCCTKLLSNLPGPASSSYGSQRRNKSVASVVSCSVGTPERFLRPGRAGLPPPLLHRTQREASMAISTSEAQQASILDTFLIYLTVRLTRLRYRLGVTRPLLLSLGHTSAMCALLALFMKDILYLRTFLVCGSLFGMGFNLLRPQPLYLPAGWGCVLIIANVIQICILLHERREVEFKSEESEAYKMLFQKHGVTNHQFEKLLREAQAEWVDLSAGDAILAEGEHIDKICLIISGEAEVMVHGESVGDMVRGFLIGESALLNKDHVATATVVAKDNMRILRLKKDRLWDLLSADEQLSHSFAKAVSSDLAAKLLHNYKEIRSHNYSFETYKEVLKGTCADGIIDPHEKRTLREYRTMHNISQAQHLEALAAVGWTLDEFDDGAKHDHNSKQPLSVQAIWTVNKQLRDVLLSATRWAHFPRPLRSSAECSELDSSLPVNGHDSQVERQGPAAAVAEAVPQHRAKTDEVTKARRGLDDRGRVSVPGGLESQGRVALSDTERPEAATLRRGGPTLVESEEPADGTAKKVEATTAPQMLGMPADGLRYACMAGI